MTCQATESCNGSDFLGINSAVREKIPQMLQHETQKKSFHISIQAKFINPSNTSPPKENYFSLPHIKEIWSNPLFLLNLVQNFFWRMSIFCKHNPVVCDHVVSGQVSFIIILATKI